MTATATAATGAPATEVPVPQASASAGRPRVAWVEAARLQLREQRDFRVAQLLELHQLAGATPSGGRGKGRHEVYLALRVAAEAALGDVDAALHRIEDGTYGRCTGCGCSISERRLDEIPSAPLCQQCHRSAGASPSTYSGTASDSVRHPTTTRKGEQPC
jgi:DnaK suppressor protein